MLVIILVLFFRVLLSQILHKRNIVQSKYYLLEKNTLSHEYHFRNLEWNLTNLPIFYNLQHLCTIFVINNHAPFYLWRKKKLAKY